MELTILLPVILGTWSLGMTGYWVFKHKTKKEKKLVYLNLRKFEIKYKKLNSQISEQAKGPNIK